MQTKTILQDAPILKPNVEHKNFTETGEIYKKGAEVRGDWKDINGLRRGKPFTYKVFITNENEIIYSKFVEPMTEVTMGADSQVSATKVEMIPAERKTTTIRVVSSVAGALIGYTFGRKKNYDRNKSLMLAGVGALAVYLLSRQFTKNDGIIVQKAK